MAEDSDHRRRRYHHGNLREALVAAALDLIDEKGANGFSFAEAARAAGVTPAAPYRHFPDRDALMAEIARRGFERFADALEQAWNGGEPSPLTAFEAVAHAYLRFAREDRPYYAAMFDSGIPRGADPALLAAADRAFAVLATAATALVRHLPSARRPPIHMMSYLFGRSRTAWPSCSATAASAAPRSRPRAFSNPASASTFAASV